MEQVQVQQPRHQTICRQLTIGRSPGPKRCILRRKNKCLQTLLPRRARHLRTSLLSRLQIPLSAHKQDSRISRWSSSIFQQSSRHQHRTLVWHCQSQNVISTTPVPSSPSFSLQFQTSLSAVSSLRSGKDRSTTSRKNRGMYSQSRRTRFHWYLVHARNSKSCLTRLRNSTHLRSLAFPQAQEKSLCQYVDTWFKLKEEAKGYPEGCTTEESKQAYIQTFLQRENI